MIGVLLFGLISAFMLVTVGVEAEYDEDGLTVFLLAGPKTIRVYPPGHTKRRKQKAKEKSAITLSEDKIKELITFDLINGLLRVVGRTLVRIKRAVHIRALKFHFIAASKSAAGTALLYGRVNAVMSALYPALRCAVAAGGLDLGVGWDYAALSPGVRARIVLDASAGELIALAAAASVEVMNILYQEY